MLNLTWPERAVPARHRRTDTNDESSRLPRRDRIALESGSGRVSSIYPTLDRPADCLTESIVSRGRELKMTTTIPEVLADLPRVRTFSGAMVGRSQEPPTAGDTRNATAV